MLSLLLTITTNILGCFITPLLISMYLRSFNDLSFSPLSLIIGLLITVAIPTISGIFIRMSSTTIRNTIDTYKVYLGMYSNINLAILLWMSLCSARHLLFKTSGVQILVLIIIALMQHLFNLLFNSFVCSRYILNIPWEQAISVIIMSSQKSNAVCLSIFNVLPVSSDLKGLFEIPCLIGQLIQIFVGVALTKLFVKLSKNEVPGSNIPLVDVTHSESVSTELSQITTSYTSNDDECKSSELDIKASPYNNYSLVNDEAVMDI